MCEKLKFAAPSMERMKEYLTLFGFCGEKASDYSFINIWSWSEEWRFEWAFGDGLCWLRLVSGAEPVYLAPVGDWNRADWLELIGGIFAPGTVFERTPQLLAEIWAERLGEHVRMEEQRSEWEYLYSYEAMASLSGNKMHKKKNRVNQFVKLYDYVYSPICLKHIDIIREIQKEWYEWRGCKESPGLVAENIAIARVLDQWENLPGILGGLLSVDGEKGLDTYKGVYQAINQMFLANTPGFETVNRQQDMGFTGMRQAKESYNPIGFVKKYRMHWLG
jgi:hypothetical protein